MTDWQTNRPSDRRTDGLIGKLHFQKKGWIYLNKQDKAGGHNVFDAHRNVGSDYLKPMQNVVFEMLTHVEKS